MSEIIPIMQKQFSDGEANAVDARNLHRELGSKQDFSTWLKAKVLNNPFFMEGQDYIVFHNPVENSKGGRPRKDYALTTDTAKKAVMSRMKRSLS